MKNAGASFSSRPRGEHSNLFARRTVDLLETAENANIPTIRAQNNIAGERIRNASDPFKHSLNVDAGGRIVLTR